MSEDTNQRRLRNDLLIYLVGFLALAVLEIRLAVRFEEHYAEWLPAASGHMDKAFLIAFLIGLAVSAVLAVWASRALGNAIRSRVNAQGSVISLRGPLENYGIALLATIWFVVSLVLTKLCDPVIRADEGPEALERVSCYLVNKSALVFIAGLAFGLLAWLFVWVVRFEKEIGSYVFTTRFGSESWSRAGFLGLVAAVLIVIIIVFYRLFTLE